MSREERSKWIDPEPGITGVLLSDRIRYYVEKINLIKPFNEKSLRPASYTLHVGDEFYCNDKQIYPDEKGEVPIHPNGLIYFKLKEKLNLPYYMIARHNLKVKQQYRGLVVGVSLHVDPGYSGHINYFAYNFTDEDKIIKVDEEIAVVDFIKTTSFGDKKFFSKKNIVSVKQLENIAVEGKNGYQCLTFKCQNERSIPDYWYGGETHKSSVLELGHKFENLERETGQFKDNMEKTLSRLKAISFVTSLVVIIMLFTAIMYHYYWTAKNIMRTNEKISSHSAEIKRLQNKTGNLKKENEIKRQQKKILK